MNSEDKKSTNEKLLFVYSKGNVYRNARFEEIRQFIWMRMRALFAMGMLLDAKIFSAISANTITKVRFFYTFASSTSSSFLSSLHGQNCRIY